MSEQLSTNGFSEMTQQKQEQIESAIYFLKVSELQQLADLAGLGRSGSKQALIDKLLSAVFMTKSKEVKYKTWRKAELARIHELYDAKRFILPGKYTNSSKYKERFKASIGSHFSFTSYGMDWIREQWEKGHFPAFEEFEAFWKEEFSRRKRDKNFESKRTLQRVNYFRRMQGRGLTQAQLEKGWSEEREKQAETALSYLKNALSKNNKTN